MAARLPRVKAGARIGAPTGASAEAVPPPDTERAGQDLVVRTRPIAVWLSPREGTRSLEGDGRAGALELLLGLVGRGLVDLLEDGLGGAVDEVLGLLETQGGQRADLLDDGDLLVAGSLEDATGGGAGSGDRDGGGGGDPEGLLELLHELRELDQGHLLEGVKELVGAELGHDGVLSELRYAVSGVYVVSGPGGQLASPPSATSVASAAGAASAGDSSAAAS